MFKVELRFTDYDTPVNRGNGRTPSRRTPSPPVYSRAKNNYNSLPDVKTVISICAGLDLDISMTTELLRLAGHTLTNSREHQAYSFIITGYKGKSIDERNEFLAEVNVPLLGSKQRK